MKKLFTLLVMILGIAVGAVAQAHDIHGIVMSGEDNEPVVGACNEGDRHSARYRD